MFFSRLLKDLKDVGVYVLMGAELEFYSTSSGFIPPEEFSALEIKKELGEGQFEAIFPPTFNLPRLAFEISRFRFLSKDRASFKASANDNKPFSALQFNFSLWKKKDDFSSGSNLLEIPDIRNSVLFFLLEELPLQIKFFIKGKDCITRLTNLDVIKKFCNSPFTISCGGRNNRTCALRLINEESNKYKFQETVLQGFRIEHRVPSSEARAFSSIFTITNSIKKAFMENPELPLVQMLHSNAFEEEIISSFNLKKIVQ